MPGGGSQKCTKKRLLDAGRAACACLWANDFTSAREALPSMRPATEAKLPEYAFSSTASRGRVRRIRCSTLERGSAKTPECSEQKFRTQVQPDTALTCLHVGSCDHIEETACSDLRTKNRDAAQDPPRNRYNSESSSSCREPGPAPHDAVSSLASARPFQ